ncbi:MAG: hypothetical protein ABI684_05370 [Nitrospirota bacterium]
MAKEAGVMVSINSDAHSVLAFENMRDVVRQARDFDDVAVKDGNDRAGEVCGEGKPSWYKQAKTYLS